MIPRFSGAILGLLAFSVACMGGLWANNSVTVTLSRAIWSLVIFCLLGFGLGAAAQAVIEDYARRRLEGPKTALESPSEGGEDHSSVSHASPEEAEPTRGGD